MGIGLGLGMGMGLGLGLGVEVGVGISVSNYLWYEGICGENNFITFIFYLTIFWTKTTIPLLLQNIVIIQARQIGPSTYPSISLLLAEIHYQHEMAFLCCGIYFFSCRLQRS